MLFNTYQLSVDSLKDQELKQSLSMDLIALE